MSLQAYKQNQNLNRRFKHTGRRNKKGSFIEANKGVLEDFRSQLRYNQ